MTSERIYKGWDFLKKLFYIIILIIISTPHFRNEVFKTFKFSQFIFFITRRFALWNTTMRRNSSLTFRLNSSRRNLTRFSNIIAFYCLGVEKSFVLSFFAENGTTRRTKPFLIRLKNGSSAKTDIGWRVSDKEDKNLSTLLRKFFFLISFVFRRDKYGNLNAKGNKMFEFVMRKRDDFSAYPSYPNLTESRAQRPSLYLLLGENRKEF